MCESIGYSMCRQGRLDDPQCRVNSTTLVVDSPTMIRKPSIQLRLSHSRLPWRDAPSPGQARLGNSSLSVNCVSEFRSRLFSA